MQISDVSSLTGLATVFALAVAAAGAAAGAFMWRGAQSARKDADAKLEAAQSLSAEVRALRGQVEEALQRHHEALDSARQEHNASCTASHSPHHDDDDDDHHKKKHAASAPRNLKGGGHHDDDDDDHHKKHHKGFFGRMLGR